MNEELRDVFTNLIFPYAIAKQGRRTRNKLAVVCKQFKKWIQEVPSQDQLENTYLTELEEYYAAIYFNGCYVRQGSRFFDKKQNFIYLDEEAVEKRDWQINGQVIKITKQPNGLWFDMTPDEKIIGLHRFFPDDVAVFPNYEVINENIRIPQWPEEVKRDPTLERPPEFFNAIFVPYQKNRQRNGQVVNPLAPVKRTTDSSFDVFRITVHPGNTVHTDNGHWFTNHREDGYYGIPL